MAFGFIFDPSEPAELIWKCEGFPDAAAIRSLILSFPEDRRPRHIVTTNIYGSTENATKPEAVEYCSRFAGADEVIVIHDCDVPGQDGATWVSKPNGGKRPGWGPVIAKFAKTVRNATLPYPIAPTDGKDVRDWIADQRLEGLDDQEIYARLLAIGRSGQIQQPAEIDGPVRIQTAETAIAAIPEGPREFTPGSVDIDESDDDHTRLARLNLQFYSEFAGGKLVFWRDEFWKWKSGLWSPISDSDLQAKLFKVIRAEFERLWRIQEEERARKEIETGEPQKPKKVRNVSTRLIRDVVTAMKSLVALSGSVEMPSHLSDRRRRNWVSMRNGLLDLDAVLSGDLASSLRPHNHEWFSALKLDYDFDPEAQCLYWQEWLWEQFEGDQEAIDALQEWFGYLLTQDTSMQRFLCVIGKSRSGKGTIMRLVKAMIGHSSVASPTPTTLSGQFGLASLIGKSLAVIPDARIGDRIDYTVLTERVLSIVGEDPQEIERKYKPSLSGVNLPIRFMLFSNEIPLFKDSSDAILNRIIILVMNKTHAGKEDPRVEMRIQSELSGILNWAILGRHRLYSEKNGKIRQPKSGTDSVNWMRIETSPVSAFVWECCQEGGKVNAADCFEAYQNWCRSNDLVDRSTRQAFAKRVRSIVPKIEVARGRDGDYFWREWIGLSLKPVIEKEMKRF
jgi:putative DNA primase/helicase